MARESYVALQTWLEARWRIHRELPNPSPEGVKSLREIRAVERTVANIEGLAKEKGWDLG